MIYYWTAEINSGIFYFWKVENEKDLIKQAKEVHDEKPFMYGETTESSYKRGRKHTSSR
jgi:hypothetical protein